MRGDAAPLALTGVLLTLAWAGGARAGLSWQDLLARPTDAPSARLAYGSGPDQRVELWRPAGEGPFPVVVVIHGGCWRADLPGLALMNSVAQDLRRRGVAVWNIEYRRIGQPGAGYPGSYQDVAAALDLLRVAAPRYGLSLARVVVLGHSAGGHLALWAAGRRRLPSTSPLYAPDPLAISAVVSLGGFSDLAHQRRTIEASCGAGVVGAMTGAASKGRPDVYADTSPASLLPLGARQTLVHGALDTISPPALELDYRDKAAKAGDRVQARTIGDAGHFELIAPGGQAWSSIAALAVSLAR